MSLLSSKSICTSPPASADEFVKQLDSDVASVLDITAPFHTVTRRVSVRPRCNWVTPEARSAKRIARRLQRKHCRSKEEVDYVNWSRAGRKAVSEIKSARAKSLRDSIQSAAQNPRQLRQAANRLLHSTAPTTPIPISEAMQRANDLSNFFVQEVQSIRLTISSLLPQVPFCPVISGTNSDFLSSFTPVSISEIVSLLGSLKVL